MSLLSRMKDNTPQLRFDTYWKHCVAISNLKLVPICLLIVTLWCRMFCVRYRLEVWLIPDVACIWKNNISAIKECKQVTSLRLNYACLVTCHCRKGKEKSRTSFIFHLRYCRCLHVASQHRAENNIHKYVIIIKWEYSLF